jgi:hypothetical protein
VPTDHGGPDSARNVDIAQCDISRERPGCVEPRFLAYVQLLLHVFFGLVHGHMARALDQHVHVVFPGYFRQLAQRFKFRKLSLVVGVGSRAWSQSINQRERNVLGSHGHICHPHTGMGFEIVHTPFGVLD